MVRVGEVFSFPTVANLRFGLFREVISYQNVSPARARFSIRGFLPVTGGSAMSPRSLNAAAIPDVSAERLSSVRALPKSF